LSSEDKGGWGLIFWCTKFRFFEIYGVFSWARGLTHCGQGG